MIDPEAIWRATALVVLLMAGVELGIAFLVRIVAESTPDD